MSSLDDVMKALRQLEARAQLIIADKDRQLVEVRQALAIGADADPAPAARALREGVAALQLRRVTAEGEVAELEILVADLRRQLQSLLAFPALAVADEMVGPAQMT